MTRKPLDLMDEEEKKDWDMERRQWEKENGISNVQPGLKDKTNKNEKKGAELDTMPYFLTAQFKEVLEAS